MEDVSTIWERLGGDCHVHLNYEFRHVNRRAPEELDQFELFLEILRLEVRLDCVTGQLKSIVGWIRAHVNNFGALRDYKFIIMHKTIRELSILYRHVL